mmetsp:Transcript_16314/g.39064  ORF Transcript_16314/g.39064 Transcript_16314/m.39064 type:complete len:207 (+) Transcript_16314:3665-4285(+)
MKSATGRRPHRRASMSFSESSRQGEDCAQRSHLAGLPRLENAPSALLSSVSLSGATLLGASSVSLSGAAVLESCSKTSASDGGSFCFLVMFFCFRLFAFSKMVLYALVRTEGRSLQNAALAKESAGSFFTGGAAGPDCFLITPKRFRKRSMPSLGVGRSIGCCSLSSHAKVDDAFPRSLSEERQDDDDLETVQKLSKQKSASSFRQ